MQSGTSYAGAPAYSTSSDGPELEYLASGRGSSTGVRLPGRRGGVESGVVGAEAELLDEPPAT